uniref:C2H2-type domain-containing protein n=1 Tax=Timema cristinae TaxID=61476 RepID=A0A7R9H837_TIMCR|nr:unnamed protein product [Timema cristinae]
MDSSSGQLSTSPVLKTLNSLNSNEQNSSFNVSLTSYNMEQELLNKNNGQHSSFPVPLLFNNVKQELLNKNNGQHSSFPAPLSFNIIKEEILANDNEEHLWFPVPSTFNHVKQELIINFNEQLPSQTVPGPLTSTSAPGIEVLDSDFITKDILKMGSLPALSEQGKNICQSRESPKQQRTSDSSSNVQPLCDMECTSNESSPYSGLSYKNSLGYISAEDSPPTGQEECYKPPSGKNVSPLSCTVCGKRFTHNRSLYYHMRIHKDPETMGLTETVMCPKCGKYFRQSRIAVHLYYHNKDKNYHCGVCSKSFMTNAQLHFHMVIHTGEKKYQCDLCGRIFADLPHWKRYIKAFDFANNSKDSLNTPEKLPRQRCEKLTAT